VTLGPTSPLSIYKQCRFRWLLMTCGEATPFSSSGIIKSYGDGGVATATGGGYCWKSLATNLHVGGSGVMVVCYCMEQR